MKESYLDKIYTLNQVLLQVIFWSTLYFVLPYINKLLLYKEIYPTQDIFYLKILVFNISLIIVGLSAKYNSGYLYTFCVFLLFFLILFVVTLRFERNIKDWQSIANPIIQKELFVFFQVFIRYVFFSFAYFNVIKATSINKERIQNEIDKKELDLHYLTHQINHHFVYNTIQLIFERTYKGNTELSKKLIHTANVLRENTVKENAKIK